MYQSLIDAMTASLFFTPHAAAAGTQRPLAQPRRRSSPGADAAGSCASALAMAFVLMVVAALVAPEQPLQQGSICERHNGPAACRVW